MSNEHLSDWKRKETLAEAMIPLIGKLYREQGIVLNIYGRKIVRESAIGILKAHRYARQITDEELLPGQSYPVLEALSKLELAPARVDLGKLTTRYLSQSGLPLDSFLKEQLASILTSKSNLLAEPQDVVLYGFGRIGRLLTRILIDRTGGGEKLRLRGIVVRPGAQNDLQKRASLLRRDSVHGMFNGTIQIDEAENAIIANGNVIKLIYASSPDTIDYTHYAINNAIVIDNTGKWRDETGLSLHLQSKGVSKVILTAPGKATLKNIVYGVNHEMISPDDALISAASCTTNAITPVLKVMHEKYRIESGHIETIHSYTNDQNLIDNYHKNDRRGRSAPLNMVITETGAAKAVAKALPELAGLLTGNAIRVPTPNVSLAILTLNLAEEISKETVNQFLRQISLESPLRDQIDFTTSTEIVSSDLVGSSRTGIIDANATISQEKRCTLYVWYDNEAGYSYQVVRVLQHMAGLYYPSLPV
ncbi:MAG: glyceraldehyde-3-phosphate dehydrogenase [Trueperaceae bacterium]|nr:glyceraldehyde-3-phosphate dehydrogenase [Trueperaceae bacterium]